jgi:hypothetical protein
LRIGTGRATVDLKTMNSQRCRRLTYGAPLFLCVLALSFLGCSPAGGAEPTTYNRIIIDTYDPVDPLGPDLATGNRMELWKSGGSSPIASDSGSPYPIGSRPGAWPNQGYAYIDYTGSLTSGDYYILVAALSAGDAVDYGIRVLAAPNSSYVGWTFGVTATEFTSDTPAVGPPSLSQSYLSMTLGTSNDRCNRHIVDLGGTSGVNWVRLHLP